MNNYQQNFQEEAHYLEKALSFLNKELARQKELLSNRKESLRESRKDMWENGVHFSSDFDKLTELNQYLEAERGHTVSYIHTLKQIKKYEKMLESPYFGRFDFAEEDSTKEDKIYVGLHNLMDSKTHEILVHDWRAPISSIFYRYELGKASYTAPFGEIRGDVKLKRQFKIRNSELKYFFDCSIKIDDEMLQDVLCRNSSPKMKNIVETIQREQDIIIRDTDNELLIVQGVAGSGKTTIALHRIAFLLYHGMNSNIDHHNILIVSPNSVFSKYISGVLPELGEENVNQITFEEYAAGVLKGRGKLQTRNEYIEKLMSSGGVESGQIKKQSSDFKGSRIFTEILDRFIDYYERNMIDFQDICYDGRLVETKQRLKDIFLDNEINMPAAKRLERIESIIMDKVQPFQKKRLVEIEKDVESQDGHEFEVKQFSRLISIREIREISNRIKKFTKIDYYQVYSTLFNEKGLLEKLSQDLQLPENINQIIRLTGENLERGFVAYEDCAPLLYMKLRLEGSDEQSDIKQVVIDEAQDYSPVQYEVFNLLFKGAGFTVLGDINQSIDKDGDMSLYDEIADIFGKKKSVKVTLNKSYRSSYEISAFASKIPRKKVDIIPFERHDAEPEIACSSTLEEMTRSIIADIGSFLKQGYESVGVICKTAREAKELHRGIKDLQRRKDLRMQKDLKGQKDFRGMEDFSDTKLLQSIKLINSNDAEIKKGVAVIPSYMAKGLEFDAVLVYNVSEQNYSTDFDRRLLYIACTRALHRLVLCCAGTKSPFIGDLPL